VSGVDDWYLNNAHRNELSPRFSHDDDISDPFVLGEQPGREWTVPTGRKPQRQKSISGDRRKIPAADRSGPWQAAAKKWLTHFPQGTNRECLRALTAAGHRGATTRLIEELRSGTVRTKPHRQGGKTSPTTFLQPRPQLPKVNRSSTQQLDATTRWYDFAADWLTAHPNASNKDAWKALDRAGFTKITLGAIAWFRRKAGKTPSARSRVFVAPTPTNPVPAARIRYCDGCGLAVDHSGRCRC
jgi:hypothetical protein